MTVRRRSFRPLVQTSELEVRIALSGNAVNISEVVTDVTSHIRAASKRPNAHSEQLIIIDPGIGFIFPDGTSLYYDNPQWAPQTGKALPNGSSITFVFKSGASTSGTWSRGKYHPSSFQSASFSASQEL